MDYTKQKFEVVMHYSKRCDEVDKAVLRADFIILYNRAADLFNESY